jgi:hypothetical protein
LTRGRRANRPGAFASHVQLALANESAPLIRAKSAPRREGRKICVTGRRRTRRVSRDRRNRPQFSPFEMSQLDGFAALTALRSGLKRFGSAIHGV